MIVQDVIFALQILSQMIELLVNVLLVHLDLIHSKEQLHVSSVMKDITLMAKIVNFALLELSLAIVLMFVLLAHLDLILSKDLLSAFTVLLDISLMTQLLLVSHVPQILILAIVLLLVLHAQLDHSHTQDHLIVVSVMQDII